MQTRTWLTRWRVYRGLLGLLLLSGGLAPVPAKQSGMDPDGAVEPRSFVGVEGALCGQPEEPDGGRGGDDRGSRDDAHLEQGEWQATTLWQSDVPVWSLLVEDLLPALPGPEIVALDELGRAPLLFVPARFESRVVPWFTIMDGRWLGAAAFGDADPRREGSELYLAGGRGNLYQVVPLPRGGFESRLVWYIDDEIHALLLDDVIPDHTGLDLLACTLAGEIVHVIPSGEPDTPWRGEVIHTEPARVRQVVAGDFSPILEGREIVFVSLAGRCIHLGFDEGRLDTQVLWQSDQGLARIVRGGSSGGELENVLYIAGDDGRLVRLSRRPDAEWSGRVIYESEAGLRGAATGRFTSESYEESIALFGYDRKVVLLLRSQADGPFLSRTIFNDSDRGHWLAAAELDPRNATDEILVCGYSGRVTLLTRSDGGQ